jgi:endonuclease/exonuclease/phosphatase family metal-dependent hydrolase
MIHKLLVRQRTVLGQLVREPTLLALILTALGFLLLLTVCAVTIYYVATFGFGWFAFVAVAVLLAALLVLPRLRRHVDAAPPTGRTRWLRRLRGAARALVAVLLAAWLGLIAWSELIPGGPMPPRPEPGAVRVLTWNILHGSDDGPFWQQQSWPRRKLALAGILREAQPDILGVQEARPEQVSFLEKTLAGYQRVGVGREGGDQGEHCAIFFRLDRFEVLADGTFWLEEPTDQPAGAGQWVKRTCTWVRLRERASGRTLRVYNAHLPGRTAAAVRGQARLSASRIVLDHIKTGDPSDAVVLVGDFNAGPDAPSRRVFAEIGLRETAALAGAQAAPPTYQFYGLHLGSLDAILVGPGWDVSRHAVVDAKPDGVFPSDHFGVLADLTLSRS